MKASTKDSMKNVFGSSIDPNRMDKYEEETFKEWFKKYHGYELNKPNEPVVWGVESLKAMYLAGMRECNQDIAEDESEFMYDEPSL